MSGNRAAKSGLAAEAQQKLNSKYDEDLAQQCLTWVSGRIQSVGEPAINCCGSMDNVFEQLGDGYTLCVVMKALGETIKFKREKLAFKKMETINTFLMAIEKYGVPKTDSFQTVDLYERCNLTQVVQTVAALARKAQSKGQPGFGPKEAVRQSREWTDEQLKAGQNVIGLQMGTNKGASQAGQSFGKQRMIID